MRKTTRLAFLCLLVAGVFFVSEQPVRAGTAMYPCEEGYYEAFYASSSYCWEYDPLFCFDMDYECSVACYDSPWPYPWYGICWDSSSPCEYFCCCRRPTS